MKKLIISALALLSLFLPVLGIATDITVSADVQKYISVTFSYSTVSFGTLTAGSTNNPAPDQTTGVYNVTVDTNYDYTIYASGTDFSDGAGHVFAVSNLKFDTDTVVANLNVANAVALSTTAQQVDTYAYTDTVNYHGYWLSIPSGQYAATYSSTVTITYSNI